MFGKVFEETSEDRAFAGILNYIAVEIITRQDTIYSGNDVLILEALQETYYSLMDAWNNIYEISPIAYASAWDAHAGEKYMIEYTEEVNMVSYYVDLMIETLPNKAAEVFDSYDYDSIRIQESHFSTV